MADTNAETDPKLREAIELATRAHSGQTDKAGAPYIEHPLRVMRRLSATDTDGRIVAVLHDVIEDTSVTEANLVERGFSGEVVEAVRTLTHPEGEPNEPYWARIAQNPLARRVKLADIADNTDEARLAQLPAATATRLREKYARARAALGADGSTV